MSADSSPDGKDARFTNFRRTGYIHSSSSPSQPQLTDIGFSEWYSPSIPGTGLLPRPGSPHSLKAHFSEIDPSWTTLYYPSRKGETVDELHNRVHTCADAFLIALTERLPEEARKRVLLFSHAATAIVLVRAFVGDPELNIQVGCCSISELVRKKGSNTNRGAVGGYEPVVLASGAHLQKGADREWGFDHLVIVEGKVSQF
jgi:transcription factor C subunit 7